MVDCVSCIPRLTLLDLWTGSWNRNCSHVGDLLYPIVLLLNLSKKLSFPPSIYLCTFFQKSTDHIYVGLFLDSLFCSIDLYVSPCANVILSWLLYLYFQTIKYLLKPCNKSPILFLVSPDCLALLGPLLCHLNLKLSAFKRPARILIRIALNLYISLGRNAISTRLSLPILEGGIFLHLFRFSLMSLSNIFLVMSYICFC